MNLGLFLLIAASIARAETAPSPALVINETAALESAIKANDLRAIELRRKKLAQDLEVIKEKFQADSPGLYDRAVKALDLSGSPKGAGSQQNQCPAGPPIDEHLINPAGIRSYIEGHAGQLKTTGDLICCLPKKYRENFVIAHTSASGQNSIATSPRVLLFNPIQGTQDPIKPLEAMFSLNGGDESLNQAHAVELISNEASQSKISFYDISMEGKSPHMSGANPQACMLCHAQNGVDAKGGLRTIFEPLSVWTRFVGGVFGPCGAEADYLRKHDELAVEAIKSNPAYRCLIKTGDNDPADQDKFLGHQFVQLGEITGVLDILNDREVAKIVRKTKDYDIYKYAIMGSLVCNRGEFQPDEWIPAAMLNMNNDMSTLDPRVRDSNDLTKTWIEISNEQANATRKIDSYQRKVVGQIKPGHIPDFRVSTNPQMCVTDPVPTAEELAFGRPFVPRNQTAARFQTDTSLKAFRAQSVDPAFRYIMESRGINTLPWEMAPVPDRFQLGHGPSLARYLVASETNNPKLTQVLKDIESGDSDLSAGACKNLKKMSLESLQNAPAAPNSTQSQRAVR